MNSLQKIMLIIKREYISRVKKRSFIVMTILGPLLMASIIIIPVWLSTRDKPHQDVLVIDKSHQFENLYKSNDDYTFTYTNETLDKALHNFYKSNYEIIVIVPSSIIEGNNNLLIYYKEAPGIAFESYVSNRTEDLIYKYKLLANKINPDVIASAKTKVNLVTKKYKESGEIQKESTAINMIVGYVGGILIYFFIFFYGSQVMQGVVEEKTSRIVEIIVSSVRPFQLMMGKIVGIALVCLTQLFLWIILTAGIAAVATPMFYGNMQKDMAKETFVNQTKEKDAVLMQARPVHANLTEQESKMANILQSIQKIDFFDIILCFIFYFLVGYLLYAALFAAIGAAIDNDADKQQFMMPITVPLIIGLVMAQTVMNNPNGSIAIWGSMIPFTSPILMMVRLPYGVPLIQIIFSIILLILGFLGTTWLAGKIYRTGILMYGKKIDYKELWKWIRHQ